VEWIGDLQVFLMSPEGTQIQLFGGLCNTPNPLSGPFDLDDGAALDVLTDCPPTSGTVLRPQEALSAFDGESPTGDWTLTVTDTRRKNVGVLQGWALQISTEEDVPPQADSVTGQVLSSFVTGGAIEQLFRVPGTYQFSLTNPTESFGAETVTGAGDTKTIIVQGAGSLKNATADWLLYR